ncbi:TIR domain-containing protein [Flavobacterium sp. RHBU_24]|uniref:TIR domain-containing protein n=1 Tax=Flavobacterium sp. RHBU_24 TaxID=3391185 RepID=UPI003984884F
MQKIKRYSHSYFPVEVLKTAIGKLILEKGQKSIFKIVKGDETLKFDDDREFFADYRKDPDVANITIYDKNNKRSLSIELIKGKHTNISVEAESRGDIEEVFEIFENNLPSSIQRTIENEISPFIFIGHGLSQQWKELKDHLVDKHDYKIESYETGSRAGHTIRDILDDMAVKSSLAFLVMTAEDMKSDGTFTARPNVIHEVGLFQGRLGFAKAIVLLEEGTEEFSNLYGIQQIRFSKNNIKETFGEVLATIKREFKL